MTAFDLRTAEFGLGNQTIQTHNAIQLGQEQLLVGLLALIDVSSIYDGDWIHLGASETGFRGFSAKTRDRLLEFPC